MGGCGLSLCLDVCVSVKEELNVLPVVPVVVRFEVHFMLLLLCQRATLACFCFAALCFYSRRTFYVLLTCCALFLRSRDMRDRFCRLKLSSRCLFPLAFAMR